MENRPWERRVHKVLHDAYEPESNLWWFAVNSLAATPGLPAPLRMRLLRAAGLRIHETASVRPHVQFRTRQIEIGEESAINLGVRFDNRARVVIGRRVGVGIGVLFITSEHEMDDPGRRAGFGRQGSILVEDGAYIGSGASVLSGVRIGRGAVVAAGAVVTKDCMSHHLYGGVPAKVLRELPRGACEEESR